MVSRYLLNIRCYRFVLAVKFESVKQLFVLFAWFGFGFCIAASTFSAQDSPGPPYGMNYTKPFEFRRLGN